MAHLHLQEKNIYAVVEAGQEMFVRNLQFILKIELNSLMTSKELACLCNRNSSRVSHIAYNIYLFEISHTF